MCGIAGIIDFTGGIKPDFVPRMLAMQRHRGPDSEGQATGEFFHVGMRRLSIIDCDGGGQPIYNENKTVFVIFNGEIYNYLELRKNLEKHGHIFSTQSDTEVLVHLYEEHGIDFLHKLNGMFVFLIADLRQRKFHLVRDRMGIKPVYYAEVGRRHVFASELRSMLASGIDPGGLSIEALANYFTYLCIPSPGTPFSNIHKVKAAHRLEISADGVRDVRWWRLEDFIPERAVSFQAATEEFKALMQDSIKLQLRSDVPVGTCLSGGVDSSLITALAAQQHPERLDTFFAVFEPAEFDERPYARLVSEQYGTCHHEITVSADEAVQNLPELAWMLDEPHGDAAALPTYLVSKFAAQHVKVCLSGLGGDELFGGYARYSTPTGRIARLARLTGPLTRSVLRPLLGAAGRAEEFEWCLAHPEPWQAYFRVLRQSTPEFLEQLFPGHMLEPAVERATCELFNHCPPATEANRRMFVDAQLYMNDQLLQFTDRMSMACSLEMRVPLIDHRIVEFSMGLPAEYKTEGDQSKRIVRRAFEGIVPVKIFDRPKSGFGPPHNQWVSNPNFVQLAEQTACGRLAADGILDQRGLDRVMLDGRSRGKAASFVWMIVCLELWYRSLSERNGVRPSICP